MILFGILYSLAETVLLVMAVLQFILVLIGSAPNTRLLSTMLSDRLTIA